MKKLSLLLVIILCANILCSCDSLLPWICPPDEVGEMVYDDLSNIRTVSRTNGEGYTVFRFYGFLGKVVLKMERESAEPTKIYYNWSLDAGKLHINLDRGPYDSEERLAYAIAGFEIPSDSSTFYDIECSEIGVVFGSVGSRAVVGEVIISFAPLENMHKEPTFHRCQSDFEITEENHRRVFSCCDEYEEAAEEHLDGDYDGLCDKCAFQIVTEHKHTFRWIQLPTLHKREFDCGCQITEDFRPHIDSDSDGICDECEKKS